MSKLDDLRKIARAKEEQAAREEAVFQNAEIAAIEKGKPAPIPLIFVYERDTVGITEDLITHCASLRRRGLITIESYPLKENPIARILELSQVGKLIVLPVMSPKFLANDLSVDLYQAAYPFYKAEQLRIVTVRAKFCDYGESPYRSLLYIPRDRKGVDKSIDLWGNRDEVCNFVIEDLKKVIGDLQ